MIAFTVYGQPAPAGSKRLLPAGGRRGGRPLVIDDSKRSRPWKNDCATVALEAMNGHEPLDGALSVVLTFYVPRPRGHFGKRGLLPSARPYPTVKPDVLKLARAVEDALTGIVYRDDAQIVVEYLSKRYGEPARVEVAVAPLSTHELSPPAAVLYAVP